MQRLTNRLSSSNLTRSSNSKTSKRRDRFKQKSARSSIKALSTTLSRHRSLNPMSKKYGKGKRIAGLTIVALLSIPAQSMVIKAHDNNAKDEQGAVHVYNDVMATGVMRVASVKSDSTFFATDGFQHGFGYDLTRAYAQNLDVDIELAEFASDAEALKAVAQGKADVALTTASTEAIVSAELATMSVSCGRDELMIENGLHPKTSLSFRSPNDSLALEASHFVCDNKQLKDTAKVANFYDQNLLKNDYNRQHFEKALDNRLPNYQSSFEKQAQNYDHDWELLVAMGYQESHLDANAVSPTGVQGLMMLTNATAKEMGVSNRVDPYQSIGGGAKYLEQMKAEFADVPNPDRLWFALASYNMGPNAVKRIQRQVEKQGKDGNSWANVFAYMSDNKASNSRYVQCMHYVTNIRSYLESLKTRTT